MFCFQINVPSFLRSRFPSFLPVAGVLCAVVLSGCGRGAQPERRRPDPTAEGKPPRIVFIAGDPQSNWEAARRGALSAQALGAQIEWKMPAAKVGLSQQKKWIYDAIESNASGIVVAPMNPTELVPPINKGGKNFVPAVVFDAPAYTKFKLTFVTTDEAQTGALAARRAGKILGGRGRAGVLAVASDAPGAESNRAFVATLQKEFPDIEIVAGITPEAEAPAVKVLFAPDEPSASRALAKLKPPAKLIAFGLRAEFIKALREGKLDALLVPDRHAMAYECVRAIMDYRANRPPRLQITHPPILVTKETLNAPESRKVLGLE